MKKGTRLEKVFIRKTSYTHMDSIFPCELVLGHRLDMIFSESPGVVFYVKSEASADLIECLSAYNFQVQYIDELES